MAKQPQRLSPSSETIKKLLLRSGNECAFPGCTEVLFNDKNKLVAECCHIEAALPGGERYNPNQSDEACRSYDNLLFLCHKHHVETDDVSLFPVDALKKIKKDHESRFSEKPFAISDNYIEQVIKSFEEILETIKDTSARVKRIDENLSDLLKAQVKAEKEKIQPKEHFGPPFIVEFNGRSQELEKLHVAYNQFNTFLICGVSGIGKSSVTAQFLANNKTHKVLWVDCEIIRTKESFHECLARFINQEFDDGSIIEILSVPDDNVIRRSILNSLQRNSCCIVFDGFDNIDCELIKILKTFNEYLSSSKIFLTSKFNIETISWKNPVYKEILGGVDFNTFVSMFKSHIHYQISVDSLTRLFHLLNGHPFLIKLSFSVLQYLPIENFINQLSNQASIEISQYVKQKAFELLSSEEFALLVRLSRLSIPFRFKIGEYISDLEFYQIFKKLKDKFFIDDLPNSFFVIPEYIRSHIPIKENEEEALDLSKSYVQYLQSIKDDLQYFEGNALIFHAIDAGLLDTAQTEAFRFLSELMNSGRFNLAYRVAFDLERNTKSSNWSFIYYVQGRVRRFQGNYEQALEKYDRGIATYDKTALVAIVNLQFERASILTYLSKELNNPELLDEAKRTYQLLSVSEDATMSLQCQLSLFSMKLSENNYEEVINKIEDLIITINLDSIRINVQAGLWQMLGDAYSKAEDYPNAFQAFDKSIDLYKEAIVKFGMNTIDGLYHLYESYGWAFANALDYSGASEMFGLCVGLCEIFDLGLNMENALFDYGFHLVMNNQFSEAVNILQTHYSFVVDNCLIEDVDMPLIHGTLSFAKWYSGALIEAVELLGLYILSSYKRQVRPVISIMEEDGLMEAFDPLIFFKKRMYILIIPSGKTHKDFQQWINIVVERRPELTEPLSHFSQFKKEDS
ncbi:tetratricopeptide repeat protein [Mucilaginibacter sp. RS28]|uniref:Tetratricopeptide repeat protein n=1 Tax=Mucilaginibacter straminoryzae TaxID=2932774 RepID=A0A9X2B7P6_9SPHI|nr:tetratricopeptide repeat protein [Mucilaginibacter straminoryzae]MCJ8208561.1 tetratricopeptide repeat protein [Mucilaginibacter straminoryzae]